MTIRAVIFDLDGLMVDTEPLHHRSFNLALERCGISYRPSEEEYGRVFVGVNAEDSWFTTNLGLDPDKIATINTEWSRAFTDLIRDPANLTPMPGLFGLLEQLESRQVLRGVASSTGRPSVETILRNLNLLERFHAIVCGTDVEKIKPAPDIYLRALEQLRVPASASIAIEDSATGIAAAKAAGLYVIAVPNRYTAQQDLSRADARVESLEEVIRIIT